MALAMMVLFSLTDLLDDAQFVARLDAFQEDMYTEIDLAFGLVRDLDPRWTQAELQASIRAETEESTRALLVQKEQEHVSLLARRNAEHEAALAQEREELEAGLPS